VDELQGSLQQTDGTLDLAIEGEGYFTVMTPQGERLTRAGAFTRNGDGTVVNMDGYALLDEGGGEIAIPFEVTSIAVSADGTMSADGAPLARIGLVQVEDRTKLFREAGVLFRSDEAPVPVENGRVLQGFLEQSNVSPIAEMARMIEVQRAYEYGQKLLDQEDERIRQTVSTLGGQA
jgi:flagellar basal-body rod protein FlgF